jgi:hypothetical protein
MSTYKGSRSMAIYAAGTVADGRAASEMIPGIAWKHAICARASQTSSRQLLQVAIVDDTRRLVGLGCHLIVHENIPSFNQCPVRYHGTADYRPKF